MLVPLRNNIKVKNTANKKKALEEGASLKYTAAFFI